MKGKNVLAGLLICTLCAGFVGCGKTEEPQAQEPAVEETTEATTDSGSEADATEVEASSEALPAYEYPGPEYFYTVVYSYIVDEFGSQYSEGQVCIPSVHEVYLDDSDKSDIKFYGDFWVYNYNLEGDTLMTQSGGNHPGVMHLKSTDAEYEVTGFDAVADGNDFEPTAKEYFGKHYDDFMKVYSDSDTREKVRAQIIANYVAANNLSITKYQDYGWDPVELPEENIDSFYSQLD
ncbi:hypothetical protein SAMN02910298_01068 [Pseudobutyrivibrio sp. YE44]|uniref:hypothetical protein n=1 Tax=Pseudobutyrivibrio sp. YE44 TaxID=1520802 RepID=UPI00087FE5B4|nr:hypothetical protein [Pseudobutyrivibrio sp. YE44]SDB22213.1 hypothetical protein SAMN02910298_01068 [Pseudobutyrivibrio sp. YE44]